MRRLGFALALALLSPAFLVPPPAASASTLTVFVEGRASAAAVDPATAQHSALTVALTRAVQAVLERHVAAPELRSRAAEMRREFLDRPLPYIQRYAVSHEGFDGEDLVVDLEAEVARDSVLARLRAMGVPVHVLSARPRILVAALGGPGATAAAQGLRRVLDAQGYTTRSFPGSPSGGTADAADAARWARDLGCHLTFVVLSGSGEAESASGGGTPADAEARYRASASAQGWIVESRREDLLARGKAAGRAEAGDPVAAAARAAGRAGERLASGLLDQLEQSGWGLGERVELVDLVVEGIPGASVLEAIGRALPSVTEVRSASLREVGRGVAVWRLEALDAGLGPEALVGALRLPRGRLGWLETAPGTEGQPGLLRAAWVEQ